ncbi:hypothetical protein Q1695_003751 [Nippostrongylus brasiliensis]|nr:hypothetical protein Q1695_003751 [Nippostrongylus brasiliensis]
MSLIVKHVFTPLLRQIMQIKVMKIRYVHFFIVALFASLIMTTLAARRGKRSSSSSSESRWDRRWERPSYGNYNGNRWGGPGFGNYYGNSQPYYQNYFPGNMGWGR